MSRTALFVAAALVVAAPAFAAPTTWDVDASHSVAAFSVRHMVVSNVRGELGKISGTLVLDKEDITKSVINTTIDVTAITTREPKRDDHLRSPDFFDVAKFPTITFKSTKIEKAGGDKLKITGELTMRGVTKTVVLDAEGPSPEIQAYGMTKTGFSATTKLNRKDFGVAFGKTMDNGGAIVGDEVTVQIDIEFNLHKDEAPAKK